MFSFILESLLFENKSYNRPFQLCKGESEGEANESKADLCNPILLGKMWILWDYSSGLGFPFDHYDFCFLAIRGFSIREISENCLGCFLMGEFSKNY
jgi:hypothetical protein